MINLLFILPLLSIPAIVRGDNENLTNTKCEDGWLDETSVGLGCLLLERRTLTFDEANNFCKDSDSRLIELEIQTQLNQVSNLLKNASDDISYYARYHPWWGGAVQVGPEQDRNWNG